ncbi:hypothetical protein [Saccharopolyspora sp. NPDC049426]|uniref:hypothetical protein n=1 Tax=Saccharopolyspora sp. NPDC049426 TaxID=3155652 RepID=UPI00343C6388
MGTALAVDPDLPEKWRTDAEASVEIRPVQLKDKAMASAAGMARVRYQLRRLGRGRPARPGINPVLAYLREAPLRHTALRRYRTWLRTGLA